MTERQKLTLNRPRQASEETTPKSSPVYRKKVWVNPTPQKQVKKPKQEVKVKIPEPPRQPKKRLPLEESISQISIFWPDLFPEHQLRPMKIGIQQDMWQEVKEKDFSLTKKRLKTCLNSIGHHIDYRALIQLGASRFDKDGQVAGEVTQTDVEDNLQRLLRRNKQKVK